MNSKFMAGRVFIVAAVMGLLSSCSGGDPILAEVNGRDIHKSEFDAYLKFKRVPQQDGQRVDQLLDDYIQREALATIIEESDYIDAEEARIEINEFRKQMLISRYFEKFLDEKVSDEAVQNYYNTHVDEFEIEKMKVSHILIRTHDQMSAEERQARLTLAQEAYSKLKTGKSFEDIAKKYSEDTVSAKQGGDLGWLKRGAIDPVFSEKAFALKSGEISEPFSTPFGFHIVKALEDIQVIKSPYEKVKGDIRYRLRQQSKQAESERIIKEAGIEKNEG